MNTFEHSIRIVDGMMRKYAKLIKTRTWQSVDVSKRPEAQMMELTNVMVDAEMRVSDLSVYRKEIQPNLPWADRHFELERVSGKPINPGETWKEWPYGHSAQNFLRGDKFSHTYAERYWPKKAGTESNNMFGIRYYYGDLMDVVRLLAQDPYTRQAYLPVWFPEDTGVIHGERVPCTLGYHFMMRDNKLNVFYPIRSCDYVRHFKDDIYLTVRLVLWMLEQLQVSDPKFWSTIIPGTFTMWIGSLHCFINDYRKLYPDVKQLAQH